MTATMGGVDTFVPPPDVYVKCGDMPDLWSAEPVRLGTGAGSGNRSRGQVLAASPVPGKPGVRGWEHVQATCAACPVFRECQEFGLRPDKVDDPMVYGGMSTFMRQFATRGYVTTAGRRIRRVRVVPVLRPDEVI